MKLKNLFSILIIVILLQLPILALADQEFEDPEIFGLEVEKLLAYISAHVAAALAILTLISYIRTKRTRLIYITIAFSLFSIKLFLMSSELFIGELPWIDIVSSLLDFGILLSFFFGVIKK